MVIPSILPTRCCIADQLPLAGSGGDIVKQLEKNHHHLL